MYLKSITLKGFKSFPDRTKLEFGPGVSVVVGPNGSGKSNVTDAVLWALGEQSPLAVRGQSMQDVIFAGAPGRQAANSAEVELLLDDSHGVLGLAVPEASIVRRLERTGEGEYRLAGARCRLVDVIELLSDTGLGREMHSVISQGRVESIVTSKPRDRRLLIEEAAGLGKHRKRRRRAQLKLIRTQDNLDRALDVEREARSRLRPLKRQAEAAELHSRLERQSLEARWELARDDLRAALLARGQAQVAAAEARVQRGSVERELDAIGNRRQAAEEALARRSAQREELSRRCFAAQSAIERISYRSETTTAAATAIEARLTRAGERLEQLRARSSQEPGDAGAAGRIAALEASLAALDRDREAELAREVGQLERQRVGAANLVRERAAVADEEHRLRSQAEEQFERARARVRSAELACEAARREAARVSGELAAVDQFLSAQTASPQGVRTLAEQLQVDVGYELALAAALDGRLRAAVVADRSAAASILDRSGADGGRALVAATSPTPPVVGSAGAPTVDAERLEGHVRGPAAAVAVARALLADTWVVASLEQVPDSFRGVAVTRRGRVWAPATHEVRQAPARGEDQVLAQRNRREQLVRANNAAADAERAAIAAVEQAASEATAAEEQREAAIAAHRRAVEGREEALEEERCIAQLIERRRAAPEEDTVAARRLELTAELSVERAAVEHAERERRERETQLERVAGASARDEALLSAVRTVIGALDEAHASISARLAEFQAALAADREAGEHLTGELRECAQQEAALHARLHHENEALTETEVRLQRVRDRAADAEYELCGLAERLELSPDAGTQELSAEEREALASRIARLARRREQLGPVNPLAQQEYRSALEHVEELGHQRTDLEAALRELEKLVGDTDRQIREKFEQTFAAAARNFEQVAAELFPGGRGRLRLVSDNPAPARVLGGAEPSAAAESSVEESEEAELPDTGAEEDVLGVEIEITPAGKEMKRLSLLSGGEKSLTALAFLFAVFLARPCPFYILDEVEAALDDLNIDRFLELLRTYSAHAQFIVVTHQKRTMEAADSLYGVSMGADGVSKVVSRRLPQEQAA